MKAGQESQRKPATKKHCCQLLTQAFNKLISRTPFPISSALVGAYRTVKLGEVLWKPKHILSYDISNQFLLCFPIFSYKDTQTKLDFSKYTLFTNMYFLQIAVGLHDLGRSLPTELVCSKAYVFLAYLLNANSLFLMKFIFHVTNKLDCY